MKERKPKIEAFYEQMSSGKMATNMLRIYHEIKKKPTHIHNLRTSLSMAHQTLTSVISTLEDIGWIVKNGVYHNGKESYTIYEAVTDYEEAKKNQERMQVERFTEWLSRGKRKGWVTSDLNIIKPLNYAKEIS
jgi:DNA-binding HxlR family transcriptional regulator